MTEMDATLQQLYDTVKSRKGGDVGASYTAKLFAKGTAKIAQKVGEEAVETVIAAIRKDQGELVSESADLLFHLLVLWADQDISLEDVLAELQKRRGVSGLDEKKARKGE
jgi:phosphoribosyl-ATP pyrophosphohydrolase